LVQHAKISLPAGTNWGQLAGAGMLAGIGFTMSIFISALAFNQEHIQDLSKIVVLISAILSIITVFTWMNIINRHGGKEKVLEIVPDDTEYGNFA
jgi:NhaA family Na+:H+ antiporter